MKVKSMTETKSVRVSGQKSWTCVQNLELFHNSGSNHRHPKGSTLWGDTCGDLYVVYSYGPHWPLFINYEGVWFENDTKSTMTTNRHRSQAHPHHQTVKLSREEMYDMTIYRGPTDSALLAAAQAGLLPDWLIPVAAKARVAA